MNPAAIRVLLVEDDEDDVWLTRAALADGRIDVELDVVADGAAALAHLRREPGYEQARRPHLVLLDLNLPVKDGRAVLAEMRADLALATIPVVVWSTSRAAEDVEVSYRLKANCYVSKPAEADAFTQAVQEIENFWLAVAHLPSAGHQR